MKIIEKRFSKNKIFNYERSETFVVIKKLMKIMKIMIYRGEE